MQRTLARLSLLLLLCTTLSIAVVGAQQPAPAAPTRTQAAPGTTFTDQGRRSGLMGEPSLAPAGDTPTGLTITAQERWTSKAPMARCCLAAAVVNNTIYAIGGYNGSRFVATVEAYDPATNTWTSKAPMPTERGGMAAAVVNNTLYAIGGSNASDVLATVEAYDPATDTWTSKAPMPTARMGLAAAAVNNTLYAIGGDNGSPYLTTMEAYDPATNTWTSRTPMPTARCCLAAAVVNNTLYAIGGSNAIGHLATVEAYQVPFVVALPLIRR